MTNIIDNESSPNRERRAEQLVAARLRASRPRPSCAFAERLERRLLAIDALAHRPARLQLLVSTYLSCAGLLLLLAALGAAGRGPFT